VLIAAPHTSNWDLPYLLAFAFLMRTKIFWLGKKQIFKPPFKHIMQWMGGIPVDRSQSNNLVEYAAHLLRSESNLKIVVTPEGTRAKITHWKTGFYHIARLAEVPIVFAYLDYSKRIGGIGGQLLPSGNIDSDMKIIKAFYADIKGKKPLNYE
jgi:1-acyl-sn-glycerol-3-phosphate acyltransferase